MNIFSCDFEITTKCNLNCIYCVYQFKGNKKELTTKEILNLLKSLKEYGCEEIRFTGGEPFLRKDFFKILKECKKLKISPKVISNGTMLSVRILKKLSNIISKIGISLDSHIDEVNKATRNVDSKKLLDIIKTCKALSIPVSIYITLTRINEDSLSESLKYFQEIGVNFHVTTVVLRGKAKNRKDLLPLKPPEYYLNYFKKFLRENLQEKVLIKNNCEATFQEPFISSQGKIYCCVEIYHKTPNYYVKDISLSQELLLNEDKLKKIRKKIECCYTVLFTKSSSFCIRIKKSCPLLHTVVKCT